MKRFLSFIILTLIASFTLTACSLFPSSDDSTTGSSNVSGAHADWVGTWILQKETLLSLPGNIDSPASGTILTLNEDFTASEDYSQLTGYGPTCTSTVGKNTGSWVYDDTSNTISFDHITAVEEIASYVDCGPGAGTTAVPRSLLRFAYDAEHDWVIELSADKQSFTATIQSPASADMKVEHTYTKQ